MNSPSLDDENCERAVVFAKTRPDFNAQFIVITHDNRLKKHFKKIHQALNIFNHTKNIISKPLNAFEFSITGFWYRNKFSLLQIQIA